MNDRSSDISDVEQSRWPDWFGWLCLIGLALLSMAVLGPLLLKGRTLSGADGLFPPDQLQYLTWIREASNHWLIGNRFDFQPDSRVFLHPGFLLSGLVHRFTGLSLQTSFLAVWKPAAVLITFIGCWLYTKRTLSAGWPQRVGMFLALFAVMPWSGLWKLTGWGGAPRQYTLDFISGEMWTGQTMFGYMMTACAVFALPLVLLGLERVRNGGGWVLLTVCSLGGAWIMWLQPWQGAELIVIVGLVELWRAYRFKVRLDYRLLLLFVATALPAIYYATIAATDSAWSLAGKANAAGAQPLWSWPIWAVVLTLAPLALPALLAWRDRSGDWQQLAVRFWPLAVVIVYFQPFGTFPYHALQGLTLPLAVLSVQAFTTHRQRWVPRPRWWWVLPVTAFLVLPGTFHKVNLVRESIHRVAYPYYIFDGESAALSYLTDNRAPGGVLADSYGGLLVPPYSGREVYLGPFSWTPNWESRARLTGEFFAGQMSPAAGRTFVERSGARFVFQQCGGRAEAPKDLAAEMPGLIAETKEFGCARVYVIKPSANSDRVSAAVGGPN